MEPVWSIDRDRLSAPGIFLAGTPPKVRTMSVYLFANNKGGVGKSTLSTNFAAALAASDETRKVLFVDLTFTKSTSELLLGDALPVSFVKLLDEFRRSKTTRDRLLWSFFASFVAMAVGLKIAGARAGATIALVYLSYVYYMVKHVIFKRTTREGGAQGAREGAPGGEEAHRAGGG